MNASLSDPYDEMLKAQSVSWLWRKVLVKSGAELWISHTNEDGVDRLIIHGKSSNGLPDSKEDRILNGTWKELNFPIFGKIRGSTRWTKRQDLPSEWLTEDMLLDDGDVILMETIQLDINTVTKQANGFKIVNGERRYVRHIEVLNSSDQLIRVRLVYDYLGQLE
ncbi:LCCL domain-containing protein [Cordyceps javanica]|uniref:LCCL domain-containing protein n=1 Tax=Cordyceps javanica TaxID=43265 RepID=A0A545VII5_9HYPO|nr:LCCL domain-containing protein [Cordyceps javanica]TQW01544.1 LCCL domain-containing protein [Cordyceps javanica]